MTRRSLSDAGVSLPVTGRWKPSLAMAVLPRCAGCGAAHPLASRVVVDPDHCPACGADAAPVREHVPTSVTGGWWIAFANFTHALARALLALASRISDRTRT